MKITQETNQLKLAENTAEIQPKAKLRGRPFKKGQSGNPLGKPAGLKNFETDFLEAVKKIADANKITRAEAMEILLRKAYSEAKNGQFNFYKDIMDRLYGKVAEKLIGDKDAPIIIQISNEIAEKNNVSNKRTE